MMGRFWSVCVVLSTLGMVGFSLTPSSFLSTVDKQRLQKVFADSLATENANSVAYGVLGFQALGEVVPESASVCQKLQKLAQATTDGGTVNTAYQLAAAAKALTPACTVKLSDKLTQAVSAAVVSDGSVGNLYYAVLAQVALGQKVDKAGLAKVLSAALKKDDSVTNLGYAFNLAASDELMDAKEAGVVYDRIEDAIVQADEVDGKMLQFEGGLTVTHLVISGAYKLSEKLKKTAAPVTKMQAVKFANYFISRKSVQQAKPAFHLVESVSKLASNKYHVPVTVTTVSSTVSETSPKVVVRICDLMGGALGKMDVMVESAMRVSDGVTVLAKTQMTEGTEAGLYEIDMFKANPGRGFYEVTVNAVPNVAAGGKGKDAPKADDRLVGNVGAVVTVKSVATVSLDAVELSIGDADQSVAAKTTKVTYPGGRVKELLEADNHHKIGLKFSVMASGEAVEVHQAFVSLINAQSGAEIVFVAEASGVDPLYSFELDLSAKSKDFSGVSGKYSMRLTVGDATIANPIAWDLADVKLEFPAEQAGSTEQASQGPKPEIAHMFREPEKRPPAVVSNAFTILCLAAPFAVLFGAWAKLGVNISGFTVSISSIGFHLGLGSIFGLYYFFWLNMTMFSTIKYLIMIGVVTFLCGNSMLSKIAEKRKAATA